MTHSQGNPHSLHECESGQRHPHAPSASAAEVVELGVPGRRACEQGPHCRQDENLRAVVGSRVPAPQTMLRPRSFCPALWATVEIPKDVHVDDNHSQNGTNLSTGSEKRGAFTRRMWIQNSKSNYLPLQEASGPGCAVPMETASKRASFDH